MTYSPSRGRVKKKWAVSKQDGPQRFVAELIQKKLIQHCWPCDLKEVRQYSVFIAARFRKLDTDFDEALEIAARIVCTQYQCDYQLFARAFLLKSEHYITERGVLKKCPSISILETAKTA